MAFNYFVKPNPSGKNFSTRVNLQEDLSEADLVATVAAGTGLNAAQVTAVGTALFREIIAAGRDTRAVRDLFGLVTYVPRSGGSEASADFQPSVDNINAGINGNLSSDGQKLFADGITFVRDGIDGVKTPLVESVLDATSGSADRCTSGGGFKLSGESFGARDAGNLALGVFLTPVAGGQTIRVGSYISWTDTEITGVWPAGLVGAQRLSVVTTYGTAPRSTTYTAILTP